MCPGDRVLHPTIPITADLRALQFAKQSNVCPMLVSGVNVGQLGRLRDEYTTVVVTFENKETFETMYKHEVSFSHMYSHTECLRRNIVYMHAAVVLTLKYSAGLFDWSSLPKVDKVDKFQKQTLERFTARGVYEKSMLKIPYVNIVEAAGRLLDIFKMPKHTINLKVKEFHKQDPAVAFLSRFPIETHTKIMTDMLVGGPLNCETAQPAAEELFGTFALVNWPIVCDPTVSRVSNDMIRYPFSLYELCNRCDQVFVNAKGKLLTHVVINTLLPSARFCPRGFDISEFAIKCSHALISVKKEITTAAVRGTNCLVSVMRNCPPEITLPPGKQIYNPQTDIGIYRLTTDDQKAIKRVLTDIGFDSDGMSYISNISTLLHTLQAENVVSLTTAGTDRVIGSIPSVIADQVKVPKDTRVIQIQGASSGDVRVLKLAQLLYIETLLNHFKKPDDFLPKPSLLDILPSNALMCNEGLCVPPKCCNRDVLQRWTDSFARYITSHKQLKFHCAPCREFFKLLCVKSVSQINLLPMLYGEPQNTRATAFVRKMGFCTLEL